MTKLTKKQLWKAASAAGEIADLERTKDKLSALAFPFRLDNFRGDVIDIPVPTEAVRKELNARIAAAHQTLSALGIEFVPGGDDE